jgi:hypothetical protein
MNECTAAEAVPKGFKRQWVNRANSWLLIVLCGSILEAIGMSAHLVTFLPMLPTLEQHLVVQLNRSHTDVIVRNPSI